MDQVRITKRVVDGLKAGETIWDRDVAGFGVRCQRRDKVYVLKKRVAGRQRWFSIGKHGSPWTPELARREAQALLGAIVTGQDPAKIRKEQSAEKVRVKDLIGLFLREHVELKRKHRTTELYTDILERIAVPALGNLRVKDVERGDINALHKKLCLTPYQANRTLAILSKMFSFAEEHGLRPEGTNPCRRVEKYREEARERFLTEEELGRLGTALEQAEVNSGISPHSICAIRLLLATGARLSEILTLKWEQVDFQRSALFLPDSKTGRKTIALNASAIEVLRSTPRLAENPYVIPGKREGARQVNLQKAWRLIREAANLNDVRLHDLRHTFASVAASSGGSLPMIGRLLGHTHASTTQRYAHLGADPMKTLGEQVGLTISTALKGGKSPT